MRSEMVRIRRGGRATPCGGRLRTATVSLSSFVFIFFGSSPESSATASLLRFWGDGPVPIVKCARTFSWSAGLMTSKLSSSSTEPRCFGIFWHSRWRHCVWSWPPGPGVVVPMRSAPLSILLLHVLHPARFEAAYSTQYLADIFDEHVGPQGRVLIFNFLIVFKCSEGRLLTGGGAATRPRATTRFPAPSGVRASSTREHARSFTADNDSDVAGEATLACGWRFVNCHTATATTSHISPPCTLPGVNSVYRYPQP